MNVAIDVDDFDLQKATDWPSVYIALSFIAQPKYRQQYLRSKNHMIPKPGSV